jgi:hypothetical protein
LRTVSARAIVLLVWQLAASALFLAAAAVIVGLPPADWGKLDSVHVLVLFLGYLLSTAVPAVYFLAGQRIRPPAIAAVGVLGFLLCWPLALVFEHGLLWLLPFIEGYRQPGDIEWRLPAGQVAAAGVAAIALNLGLAWGSRPRARLLPWVCAAAVVAVVPAVLPLRAGWLYRGLERPSTLWQETTLHALRLDYFRGRIEQPAANGGGLLAVGGRWLLVTGDGRFHVIDLGGPESGLAVQALPYRTPMNAAEFRRDNPGLSTRQLRRFRTMDLLLAGGGSEHLLVSHHHWDAARQCTAVRVSVFDADGQAIAQGTATERWRTLWETADCLPARMHGLPFFDGHRVGGAMLPNGERHFLLALGDQGFDGLAAAPSVSQSQDSEYGKILEIDLRDGAARVYASGLRSPGGFYRAGDTDVWFVEHGPRGGDELNRLRRGANYGWPCRSLGAEYDGFEWPVPAQIDCNRDFEEPAFAWSPSIGTAAVLGVSGPEFARWQGDLLVAGLALRGLTRVHMVDGRPVLAEPIPVFERVRDLAQDAQGRLILWTDNADIVYVRSPTP